MATVNPDVANIISSIDLPSIIRATLYLAAGIFGGRMISSFLNRALKKVLSQKIAKRLSRIALYLITAIFFIIALQELGFKLGVILGALGIFSVAIGFASQTSVSNVISGLFLMIERSFTVGDTVEINSIRGKVMSIDFLSVKLRTPDNMYVRIPNEVAIKSYITNVSHYPTRRFSLFVGVGYSTDLDLARKVLLEIATTNEYCLDDPAPKVIIDGFGDSSINLHLQAWCNSDNYLLLSSSLREQVKKAFEQHHIEIPFPQRVVNMISSQDA